MFDSLITAIQNGVQTRLVEDSTGLQYWTRSIALPPAEPVAEPIEVSTLTGLVDYIKHDLDGEITNCHIQIVSPTSVKLCKGLSGRHRQRECLAIADCQNFIGSGFPFDRWMDPEKFIIGLQSQFGQTENRNSILSIIGCMADEEVRETNDDGVSQSVTTRAGIRRKESTAVPNPVILSPYRTFIEIEQPECSFMLRLRRERNVEVALFEAGGGKWKSEAVLKIAEYLREVVDIPVLA